MSEQTEVEEAKHWLEAVADLSGSPLSWSVAVLLADHARLTDVVEAARALHAIGRNWSGNPEWSALGAALGARTGATVARHIQECGDVHPPNKAVCQRCHHKIFQRFGRNWFNCPDHMSCCYRGEIPTGADLGVRHVPFELDGAE